jgi:hypothetical protein
MGNFINKMTNIRHVHLLVKLLHKRGNVPSFGGMGDPFYSPSTRNFTYTHVPQVKYTSIGQREIGSKVEFHVFSR